MKELIMTYFQEYGLWLLIAYAAVIVAMGVDLVTGVKKSRRRGERVSSSGFKRTCEKAAHYLMPMLCLTCVDLIAARVMPFPAMTMIMGGYCVFCEWVSVMESTWDKKTIERGLESMSKALGKGTVREMLTQMLREELAHYLDTEAKNKVNEEEENNEKDC